MNTTVQALREMLKEKEHKLWLAITSLAYAKGTNKATVMRISRQIVALEEAISHFGRD